MKKQIAVFALVAAAFIAAPAVLQAQDAKPEAGQSAEHAPKKKGVLPFNGKVVAVDAAASTVTVGKTTIAISADTKIMKNGQPATLADITVGETIGGAYKKDDAGNNNAVSIRIGAKPATGEGKKPKKADQE